VKSHSSTPLVPWNDAEREFAALLVRNGWKEDEALTEARRALLDASEEDGYDA
jgi:hypothetical protein